MAAPSKAMFDLWRTKELETPARPFFKEFQAHAALNPRDLNLRNVFLENVKAAEAAMDEATKKLREIPIFKWSNKQSGFLKAIEAVGPNLQKRKSEKYNWAEEVIKSFDSNPEGAWSSSWLERMFSYRLGGSWSGSVFHALDEYYFSDKADELYKLARQGPKAYEAMIQATDKLLSLTKGHQELKYENSIRRLKSLLTDPAPSFDRLPITKNSQHKAEQLFVYRVWLINQQYTGKPKAEAIAELMTLDGFDHVFDKRTVERMCARFKAAKLHLVSSKSAVAEIKD